VRVRVRGLMRRLFLVISLVAIAACGGGSDKPKPDSGSAGDAGIDAPPNTEVTCEVLPPVSSGTCEVTPGGTTMLLKGTVLTPTTVFHGGQVAVDTSGRISCVGCNCAAGGETVISCPDGAISPGLINTHDHITFTQDNPYNDTGERYEHRHQWRTGSDGHTKIPSQGSATGDQIRWGELRFLMGGATSIVGSGGQAGLLRNLDQAANMEGLQKKAVNFDTFPLDDSSGTRRTMDCNYGSAPTTAASIANNDAYEPHTSEGIDRSARNEFLCESSTTYDTMTPGISDNLVLSKTSMIHAIGLLPSDYGAMAAAGTGLIWSPRSNITLYGDTARVSEASRLGVNIALGTDWMPTGSMNLLRELKCADSFNQTYLGTYFTDEQLWQMVTVNAAAVTKTDDVLGVLANGHIADISIFAAHGKTYRAVIDAAPEDVVLVMRGGKTLYGDATVVGALAQQCDAVDVCGTSKNVCLMGEVGKTYSALKTGAGATTYPAFACGAPMNEPSCTPKRPVSVAASSIYTGTPSASDSDGDGTPDASDKCPHVFDPVRPLDGGAQADADADGVGDACDPCPLDANTTSCTVIDPNDRDHDGVVNASDNCPDKANADQADGDQDGHGDVCDACPAAPNPGAAGCPVSIYDIKNGTVPVGTSVRVVNALVTGKGSNGFFVQVKEGDTGYIGSDYSGLFVFTGPNAAQLANAPVGGRVTVDGSVDVFVGETELDNVTAVTLVAMGPEAPPAPITATYAEVATGGTRAAKLESVIVALPGATVTAQNTTFGEFTLTAAAVNLVVDDFLYAQPTTIGQTFSSATGILATKSAGGGVAVSKLHPRSAADMVSGAPALASLMPMMSYSRAGTTGNTIPAVLTVSLSGPAQGDTPVTMMSSDTNALMVSDVTILNGQTSATVPVTGVAQSMDVMVIAMVGMQMQIAHVRVLGATEAPATVTLAPPTTTVAPNGSTDFSVTLDIPAPPGGTVVSLSATQGTVPPTVTVPADQTQATFTYTDTVGSGTATVSANIGGAPSTATVTVNSTTGGHIVINEIDYDQIGTDATEYVELYNPTTSDISLANLAVVLINGSNNAEYGRTDISSATTLPAGGYLVLAPAGVTVPATALKVTTTWANFVQNGAPDGIALIDTSTSTLIDALSYEGNITAAVVTGFPSPVSLVEGTALAATVADSNTADGSLCRTPNGSDTNDAATDWHFCTTLSVGTANP
jgi:hypothetical protein